MIARIGQLLLEHARKRPARPALMCGDRTWTYEELASSAAEFAAHLARCGAKPGHRLTIACESTPEFAVAYLGAVLCESVPVIVAPENLTLIDPRVAATTGVVTAPPFLDTAKSASPYGVHSLSVAPGRVDALFYPGEPLPQPQLPRTGHVLYTSGSTGKAKAIAWSDERLAASAWDDWLFRGEVVGMLSPLFHAAGVQLFYRALCDGLGLALIEQPHAIALACEQLARHGVSAIKCMPPHVELILGGKVALPACVQRIQVSGAPIDGARLLEFAAHVAPAAVRKVYGTAESGALACLSTEDLEAKGDTVGRPRPDVAIEILDDHGAPCAPFQTGEVVARLLIVPEGDGYLAATAEQAARFRGDKLFTKDRGHLDDDGYLVLTERSEELIKSAGKLVSATKLERILRAALPGVSLAIARVPEVERGEAPCVVFEPEGAPSTEREWLSLCQRNLADYEAPRLFVPVRRLPETATGKLARAALNELASAICAVFPDRQVLGPRLCPATPTAGAGQVLLSGVVPAPGSGRPAFGLALLDEESRRIGDVSVQFGDAPRPLAVVVVVCGGMTAGWLDPYAQTIHAVAHALGGGDIPLGIAAAPSALSSPPVARAVRYWLWQSGGSGAPDPAATPALHALEAGDAKDT